MAQLPIKEKVKKALEIHSTASCPISCSDLGCPYSIYEKCAEHLIADASELLKGNLYKHIVKYFTETGEIE